MRRLSGTCLLFVAVIGLTLMCLAPLALAKTGRDTGLPIPRFVSLRADTVNMRAGPGLRYPIEWVFKRRGLPVVVLQEFNIWRRVRSADGTIGWVHGAMLDGRRTAQVMGDSMRALREDPSETSGTVALLQPGVLGELDRCRGAYCYIDVGAYGGWIRRTQFYGVLRNEQVN